VEYGLSSANIGSKNIWFILIFLERVKLISYSFWDFSCLLFYEKKKKKNEKLIRWTSESKMHKNNHENKV